MAKSYFGNIKDAITTIFEGLAVTASHLIRKPYTVQYPDRIPVRVQDTLPIRYRGILEVDLDICTGCLACERACPIDCIVIVVEKDKQTLQMLISQFDIDIAKCMYCGLCSEPCPTGAIHHTTEFEGADYSLESLIRRFVVEPVVAYKPKKGPEPDPAVASLLERGMKYVDQWAQPGSDKPPTPKAASSAQTATPQPAKPAANPARMPAKGAAAAAPKPSAAPARKGADGQAVTQSPPAEASVDNREATGEAANPAIDTAGVRQRDKTPAS